MGKEELWCAAAVAIVAMVAVVIRVAGINRVKQWLLFAVCEAEKQFGSGTGKLKLATVYAMFLERFPKLSRIMSYSLFSNLVDEALEIMREWLRESAEIAEVIEKGEKND